MEEVKKKKKSHAGLIVLIVILCLLIIPPAVAYTYLYVNCNYIDKMKVADPSGVEVEYLQDGTVELTLSAGDLFPFLEQFDYQSSVDETVSLLPVKAEIKNVVPELTDDTLRLSVSARLFNFLPVPLIAEGSFSCKAGEGELFVTSLKIGKRISIPTEKLPLDMPLTFDLTGEEAMPRLDTATIANGKLHLRQHFLDVLMDVDFDKPFEPIAAEVAVNTPGGIPADATLAFFAPGEPEMKDVFGYIAGSKDSSKALLEVLSLMRDYPRDKILNALTPYEKAYIFSYGLTDVQAQRNAYLASECFKNAQLKYDTVLSDIADRYKNKLFTLDGKDFLSGDSLTPLSFDTEYPGSGLTDADTKLCFMSSFAAWLGSDTLGMPNIDEIPADRRYKVKEPLTKGMFYSLALVTRLPDGTPGVVYYTAPGIFTECEIEEERYSAIIAEEGYSLIMTDELVKPAEIYLRNGASNGLKDAYYFVRPHWND